MLDCPFHLKTAQKESGAPNYLHLTDQIGPLLPWQIISYIFILLNF